MLIQRHHHLISRCLIQVRDNLADLRQGRCMGLRVEDKVDHLLHHPINMVDRHHHHNNKILIAVHHHRH